MVAKSRLISPANNSPGWDVPLNANFVDINTALGGQATLTLSNVDVTLTDIPSPGAPGQTQNLILLLTSSGAMTGNVNVIIPGGVLGFWIVANQTTGPYTVTMVSTSVASGGAAVAVPQGYATLIYCDGANVYLADAGVSTLTATPSGAIQMFGMAAAPAGWLLCDGTSYATGAYPNLFAAIGYTWGGSGGNFLVPDMIGAFPRGASVGANNGLNPSPRAVGSYEADGNKSHTHGVTDPQHHHGMNFQTLYANGLTAGASNGGGTSSSPAQTGDSPTGISILPDGNAQTTVRNFAVTYAIKY